MALGEKGVFDRADERLRYDIWEETFRRMEHAADMDAVLADAAKVYEQITGRKWARDE